MNNNIYYSPALYSHGLNGLFLVSALYLLYKNSSIEPHNQIMILLLVSISFGIHSLSHIGLEIKYNFNPLNYLIKKNNY